MSWILLKEYPTEMDAEIVMGRLDSEGIKARVTCDNVGGLHAGISPAMASAKLFVLQEDKDKALEVLANNS